MRLYVIVGAVAVVGLLTSNSRTAETAKDKEVAKAKLQAFNDYIGAWKSDGEMKTGKSEFWKESMDWGWKFGKDGSSALKINFKDSKNFTDGELKFLTGTKKYELTLTTADKKQLVYEGDIKRKVLTFTRVDPATKNKYTLTMNTTNEGALFNMEYMVQTGGVGLDKKLYLVRGKKEGASISGGKKNECIISGGVGTIAVSYGGKTYYVCCGGCRDAFNDNPKKAVEDFEKKKK